MAKLTLSQFQHLFSQASLRPEATGVDPTLLNGIVPGGTLTSDTALEVYRTGHIVRLTEAMGETFEAVWWVAGDEHYFELAKEFLLTHFSTSYNLSDFGKFFPDFLEKRKPFSDLPFLADLARFEWLFKEVFHLPPHIGLTPEDFQQQPLSGNLRLAFGPSIRLFRSPYSVYEVWKLRGTTQESLSEKDWNKPQWLLCYKHQQQVYIKHVNEPAYILLNHLNSGASIEESLDRTLQEISDITATTVSDLFGLIKITGIVTAIRTDPLT
jgi:hypothetical protein